MTTSGTFYLSFPKGYVSDADLSTAIQHRFNSSRSTVEHLEFMIRRFWSQISNNDMLKAEIIHYALFWSGSDKNVLYFYHFYNLLKPNLDLVIDRTRCWTFSYKMTNLQFAVHRYEDKFKLAALLLAHGANPDLRGPAKPLHVAGTITEIMPQFNKLLADLNNLPRAEYLKKYNIEDPRGPKVNDINGFEFNKLLPEIQELILNMVIDRHFEWLRLVNKNWRDLTMKILRAKIPRLPKKMIGEFEASTLEPYNETRKLPVTRSVTLKETDEISLKIFHERMDLSPTSTDLQKLLPEELEKITSFPAKEFHEFIFNYYESGCQYVATEMSVSTYGDTVETNTRLFVCKAAGFGILILYKSVMTDVPDQPYGEFF